MNANLLSRSWQNKYRALGFALVIVGPPLGMYMNQFIANISWNTILMALALMFIPDWKDMLNMRFPSLSGSLKWIVFFTLLCLAYAFVAPPTIKEVVVMTKTKVVPYLLFTLFFVFSCGTLTWSNVDVKRIIKYAWSLSVVTTLCAYFCISTGLYSTETLLAEDEDSLLSSLTMGFGCVNAVIVSLFLLSSKKTRVPFIAVVTIIINLALAAWIGKRTPFLLCVLSILIYVYMVKPYKDSKLVSRLIILALVCTIALLFLPMESLVGRMQEVLDRSSEGISDMINGTSNSGQAAVMRYHSGVWALNHIADDMNLLNYIFGSGFMVKVLDIPSLQAFVDMGLIGFCFYNWFVVIYPLYCTVSKKYRKAPYVLFACLLCMYPAFATLNSGSPYGFLKWWPVIFLILMINLTKEKQQNQS